MLIIPIGDINPRQRIPLINYAILIINIVVFILLAFKPNYRELVAQYGLIPQEHIWYTFITSTFLHADIFHLLGNMLFLWIVGDNVEDKFGHLMFLFVYLISGIVAGVAHTIMFPISNIPCIGASGAVAGILGIYVVFFPFSRIKFWYFFWFWFFIRMGIFTLASIWAIGFWFLEQLLLAEIVKAQGIAYWAHIGGFLLGVTIAIIAKIIFFIIRK